MQKDDPEALTSSLNSRAMLFLELNSFNTALSLLHQAIYILKSKKQTEAIAQLKVTTLNNLGCVYKQLEKPKKALYYLNEALSLSSRYASSIDTSSVHLNISSIKSAQSAHEEALFHAMTSLKLCTLTYSDSEILPLLSSYYQTGSEYSYLHQVKEAKKYFKQGFELAHRYLGKSHQMTLKFFKALHDKNLFDIPDIKKSLLKPIIERLGKIEKFQKQEKNENFANNGKFDRVSLVGQSRERRFEFGDRLDRLEKFGNGRPKVKSTEPRSEYKIYHQTHSSNPTPIRKVMNKSSNASTKELIPNGVQNQINYIGNALGTIKKKIEKFSDSFQLDQVNENLNNLNSMKSKSVKKNRVKAGIIVQKTLRMWKDRKKFVGLKENVIKIQRAYRKFSKIKELKRRYLRMSTKCIFSQQFPYQNLKAQIKNADCQMELDTFCENFGILALQSKRLNFWKSLISLQKAIKRFLNQKKMVRAAVFIQKYFRRFIVRKKFFGLIKVVKLKNKIKGEVITIDAGDKVEETEIIFKSIKMDKLN